MSAAKKPGAVILVLCALVAAACWIWWMTRGAPDEAERVRQAILEMAEGAERADLKMTMAPVSTTYRDDDGLTRDRLKGYLFMEFRRRGPLHTLLSPIEVSLADDGRSATASFTAVVGEGAEGVVGELLPQSGDVFAFELTLQREADAWRITSHERFGLDGERLLLSVD